VSLTAALCNEPYLRPDGTMVRCTFIAKHPTVNHSWFAVSCQDAADEEKVDYTPTAVQALLDGLLAGDLDEYVEAILAAGHTRKRQRRGEHTTFSIKVTPPK